MSIQFLFVLTGILPSTFRPEVKGSFKTSYTKASAVIKALREMMRRLS